MKRILASDLLKVGTSTTAIHWMSFFGHDGFIGRKISTLLSSHAKGGKSTTVAHVVRDLLQGKPQPKVTWVTEEPLVVWKDRLIKMPGLRVPNLALIFPGTSTWQAIFCKLEDEETDLLIIDTIRYVIGTADENDQSAVMKAMKPLIRLARQKNLALLLIHHLRKGDAAIGLGHAGSHAIAGVVDVGIELHGDKQPNRRVLKTRSRFDITPSELVIERSNGDLRAIGHPAILSLAGLKARVQRVLDTRPKSRDEIANLLDPKPSTGQLHAALDEMVQEGQAVRKDKGVRGSPHRWVAVS